MKKKKPPPYLDLYEQEEDERIRTIGETVMRADPTPEQRADGKDGRIAFLVELIEKPNTPLKAKGNRYVKKLLALFPDVEVIGRMDGPVPNVESIFVRRKTDVEPWK
jgi:hypothetical protein